MIEDFQDLVRRTSEEEDAAFNARRQASAWAPSSQSQNAATDPFFEAVAPPNEVPTTRRLVDKSGFKVTSSLDTVTVGEFSFLFASLSDESGVSIDDLDTPLPNDPSYDACWLEIEFTAWPDTFTAAIKVGTFPAGGEIEDDTGMPPVQTFARKILARLNADGSNEQIVKTNLEMRMFLDAGLPINYPQPR